MSALSSRHETGLALLRLVLRSGVRTGDEPLLFRRPLQRPMRQLAMQAKITHAVHAVLSLVPSPRAPQVENQRFQGKMRPLWMGRFAGFLELLPLVS